VPPRVAYPQQRRPPRQRVRPQRHRRISLDQSPHPFDVAEDHRGAQVETGDPRVVAQQLGRPVHGHPADARPQKRLDPPGPILRAGLDLSLERGPAQEAVLSGDHPLRRGQVHRVRLAHLTADPNHGGRITRSRGG
jgi:hypothetical protein